MAGNGIGDEGVKAVIEMLKVNTTLTELNVTSDEERKKKEKREKKNEW